MGWASIAFPPSIFFKLAKGGDKLKVKSKENRVKEIVFPTKHKHTRAGIRLHLAGIQGVYRDCNRGEHHPDLPTDTRYLPMVPGHLLGLITYLFLGPLRSRYLIHTLGVPGAVLQLYIYTYIHNILNRFLYGFLKFNMTMMYEIS